MKQISSKLLVSFLVLYVILSLLLFWGTKNYEFLYYLVVLFILMYLVLVNKNRINISNNVVTGLIIYSLLHTFGGTYLSGEKVFDIWLLPNILRYDQFVHMFGGFMIAILTATLLRPYVSNKLKNTKVFFGIIILISLGIASLWEIIELGAVLLFISTGVGDYFNNTFDLLFNAIGALIGSLLIFKNK